jgi:hypothetical protein
MGRTGFETVIDRQFVGKTAELLRSFGHPDASIRRADGFAAAYLAERGIPPIEADDSNRNDSSAVLYSHDMRASDGHDYRVVVCAIDRDAAQRVETELWRELDSGVIHAGRGAFV